MKDSQIVLDEAQAIYHKAQDKLDYEYSALIKVRGMRYVEEKERNRILAKDNFVAALKASDICELAKHILRNRDQRRSFESKILSHTGNLQYLITASDISELKHAVHSSMILLNLNFSSEFPTIFAKNKNETKVPSKAVELMRSIGLSLHSWTSEDDGVVFIVESCQKDHKNSIQCIDFFPMRPSDRVKIIVSAEEYARTYATDPNTYQELRATYQKIIHCLRKQP